MWPLPLCFTIISELIDVLFSLENCNRVSVKIVLHYFLRKLLIEDFLPSLNYAYAFPWSNKNGIPSLIPFINSTTLRKKVVLRDWSPGWTENQSIKCRYCNCISYTQVDICTMSYKFHCLFLIEVTIKMNFKITKS